MGDVRFRSVGEEAIPTVYFPLAQRPFRVQFGGGLLLEAESIDAAALVEPAQAVLLEADPDMPAQFSALSTLVAQSLGERRLVLLVLSGFSMVSLLLAGFGVFGVVSYSVARRTREMGVRIALGADPSAVRRMIVKQALRLIAGGLVVGSAGALVTSRVMRGLLYGVGAHDPLALGAAVVLLLAAGVVASWLPAHSGTRVDALIAIRGD